MTSKQEQPDVKSLFSSSRGSVSKTKIKFTRKSPTVKKGKQIVNITISPQNAEQNQLFSFRNQSSPSNGMTISNLQKQLVEVHLANYKNQYF